MNAMTWLHFRVTNLNPIISKSLAKKVVEDDSDEDLERMMASIKSECGIAKIS